MTHCSSRTAAIAAVFALACLAGLTQHPLYGQAEPTAIRSGDLQVGGMFNLGNSDYSVNRFQGYGAYATFDVRYHLGLAAEFHQLNDPNSTEGIYERTYLVGPRYVLHYRRFRPYVEAMYGRGVFNFSPLITPNGKLGANLAYNLAAGGVGVDYRLRRSINLRADYEYQNWIGFRPHGLTPSILEFGGAYHFH
jgi:hypothetical protein